MQDKRINAGYEIIRSFSVGDTEFVLGRNVYAPSQFVTWECSNGNNYFWGHYFSNYSSAMADLFDRAETEICTQRSLTGYSKEEKTEKKTKIRREREER